MRTPCGAAHRCGPRPPGPDRRAKRTRPRLAGRPPAGGPRLAYTRTGLTAPSAERGRRRAGGPEPPPAEAAEDPVDLSRLHYGVEDYVKMGVPEEDARAILRAVNKLAKDRDAAQGPPDAAPAADAAAV